MNSKNKYALLIGINYFNTSSQLYGCINDALNMGRLLVRRYKHNPRNITLITDHKYSRLKPTKQTILNTLKKIVNKIKTEKKIKEFWIFYSGHGASIRDRNNDESDNKDEVLVPIDYHTGGLIVDDELQNILKDVPQSCRIMGLFDCCHSGTILDLKYKCNFGKNIIENKNASSNNNMFLISGCKDNQVSQDFYNRETGKYGGALTCSFLDSLNKMNSINFFDLLQKMRNYLKKRNFQQIPELTSNTKVNKDTYFLRKINNKPYFFVQHIKKPKLNISQKKENLRKKKEEEARKRRELIKKRRLQYIKKRREYLRRLREMWRRRRMRWRR